MGTPAMTRVYFNNGDSTDFDTTNFAELYGLWLTFCAEEQISPNCIEQSEIVHLDLDDYDEDEEETVTIQDFEDDDLIDELRHRLRYR